METRDILVEKSIKINKEFIEFFFNNLDKFANEHNCILETIEFKYIVEYVKEFYTVPGDIYSLFVKNKLNDQIVCWKLRYSFERAKLDYKTVLKFSNLIPWDYRMLSENPSITFEDFMNNLDHNWDIPSICSYKKPNFDFILANPEIPWDFQRFSDNIHVTFEDVLKYPEIGWEFSREHISKIVTSKYFFSNLDKNWNLKGINANPNLHFSEIFGKGDKMLGKFISTWLYSKNPNLKFEDILSFGNHISLFAWNWIEVSCHPNITFDIIKDHPEFPWDWYFVSMNPNININHVKENLGLNWKWDLLSCHPNIKISDIINNLDLPWNWHHVSYNVNLKIDDIAQNPELPWEWNNIQACRLHISVNDVKKYPHLPWNWRMMSHRGWTYYESMNKAIDKLIGAYRRMTDGPTWDNCLKCEIMKAAWSRDAWQAYIIVSTSDPKVDRDDAYGQYDEEVMKFLEWNQMQRLTSL
jgi:hypothetical protein